MKQAGSWLSRLLIVSAAAMMAAVATAGSAGAGSIPVNHVHLWFEGTPNDFGHSGVTSAARPAGGTVAFVGFIHSATHTGLAHHHLRWTLGGTHLAHLDSFGLFSSAEGLAGAIISSSFDAKNTTSILSMCVDDDWNSACDAPAAPATVTWGDGAAAGTAFQSMAVIPSAAVVGSTFGIAGTLTHDFLPIAGTGVQIDRRAAGTPVWSSLGTAMTNGAGSFVVHDTPTYNTEYRARFAGEMAFLAATSKTITAFVRAGITLIPSTTSPHAGDAVRLSGRVVPAHPGAHVTLQQYVPGHGWQAIAHGVLGPASTYAFTVTQAHAVSRLYRSLYDEQPGSNAWNVTPSRRITWH